MLMNWVKRLFFKSTEQENSKIDDFQKPNAYRPLVTMEQPIIHPCDFLDELIVRIALLEKKPVSVSSTEVKLYNLSEVENGKFIGSFYALFRNGIYYGNIVGEKELIACHPQAFRFEETNNLFVPLGGKKGVIYALICDYACENGTIKPLRFIQTDSERKNDKVLHCFEKGTTLHCALNYCFKKF